VCICTILATIRFGVLGGAAKISRFNIFMHSEQSEAFRRLNPFKNNLLFFAQLRLRPESCLILGFGYSIFQGFGVLQPNTIEWEG